MLFAGLIRMFPPPKKMAPVTRIERFTQLLHRAAQPQEPLPEAKKTGGRILAFTGAASGAGASYISRQVGIDLSREKNKRILIVQYEWLETVSKNELDQWLCSPEGKSARIAFLLEDSLSPATTQRRRKAAAWRKDPQRRKESLDELRKHFDLVLIDCKSVKATNDVLLISRLVDEVVLVASPGRTRRKEVEHCQRMIELSGGTIAGFILNKRIYSAPGWLYHKGQDAARITTNEKAACLEGTLLQPHWTIGRSRTAFADHAGGD